MKFTDLNEEKAAELKRAHGDELVAVRAPNGDAIVLKPPTKPIWHRWITAASKDGSDKGDAMRMLSLGCMVVPETEQEGGKLLDRFPGLPVRLVDKITELSGASAEEDDSKKL